MKYCTNCGKQLPDEAKFCFGCGKPQPVKSVQAEAEKPVCPNCGEVNETDTPVCRRCGCPLDGREIPNLDIPAPKGATVTVSSAPPENARRQTGQTGQAGQNGPNGGASAARTAARAAVNAVRELVRETKASEAAGESVIAVWEE